MPWCPKCGIEYREGFSACADCGSALVDARPDQSGPEQPDGEEGWEHLVFLYSEMEADIVIGLLETEGIPVIKTYKGMGVLHKVYTGKATGVDLLSRSENWNRQESCLKNKLMARKDRPGAFKPLGLCPAWQGFCDNKIKGTYRLGVPVPAARAVRYAPREKWGYFPNTSLSCETSLWFCCIVPIVILTKVSLMGRIITPLFCSSTNTSLQFLPTSTKM